MRRGLSEFVEERDNALFQEYRKAYAEIKPEDGVTDFFRHAARRAARAPQRRHWMSYWGVYRAVLRAKKGGEPRNKIEREVKRMFNKMSEETKKAMRGTEQIAQWILEQPAIGFFLSEHTAIRIIYDKARGKR